MFLNVSLNSKQQPIGVAEQLSSREISNEMNAVRPLKTPHVLHGSLLKCVDKIRVFPKTMDDTAKGGLTLF